MAKPIKPTPTLKGKYATQLIKSVKVAEHSPSKKKFLDESHKLYEESKAKKPSNE